MSTVVLWDERRRSLLYWHFSSVFWRNYSEMTGHFVLVIMWMYDVLLQVCLAIAHYSHPADPQLLFGFEYVGKRYHGSTGRKTLMRPWQQITRVVSTRAAKLSWAIHTFSFPASQDRRRLSRECKELVLWIAGPYNKIYMAAIIVACSF